MQENSEFDNLIYEAEKQCERRNADALKLIERARQIADSSGQMVQLALLSYIEAYYDIFVSNNYDRAINSCQQALSNLDEESYQAVGYKLLMTLGNSYHKKGDQFSAQDSYLKGLKSLQLKPALSLKEEKFLAGFYYNLSILLSSHELNPEAEGYLQKAIEMYLKQDNKFKLSKCYSAYAQIFELKENYLQAIDYLNQALAIDEEIKDAYSIALSKANLGILSVKINDYEKSFLYLKDALEFYEKNSMVFESGVLKYNLGNAYIHSNKVQQGLDYINQAEDLMVSLDNKKELSEIYRAKSKALAGLNDHAGAYNYLERYVETLKFFFDSDKTNALTRARKEFEFELKEKEAKLLREKNEEIQDYVHKLEISNNELKQFAHVASHDLREPLRMIMSYISLLKRSLNEQMNEQQLEFFGFVLDGAKRMDQLIQDLLRLAKVDANLQIERIKLANVMEEIKLNLETLTKEKNAVINIGPLPFIQADRTQMLQLFQNLIANGIKYNKSAVPEIKVSCIERKDKIEIMVADNGIGIPKHLTEEAFQIFRRLHKHNSTPGSGIGLAICKKIVESMGGTIKIEDAATGGTIFRVTFNKTALSSSL